MCGRFSLRLALNEIEELFGYDLDVEQWEEEEVEFVPRYNIAPRSQAPVIRHRDPGSSMGSGNPIIIQTMKWGLVPHWSKFEDKSLNTINARAENLIEGGGMWDSIKGKKRCAVPCQGYYEWLTKGKDKIPHFTKRKDNKLLLMAGLYDSVVLEGKALWTFAIVTTDSNKEFSWLHDRQPVFLTNHDAVMRWLDTSSQTWTPELTKIVQPYSDASALLECYPVPKEVGKVGTESPSFIEPIAARRDGINAMFSKQEHGSMPVSPTNTTPGKSQKRKTSTGPSPSKVTDDNAKAKSPEATEHREKRMRTSDGASKHSPSKSKAKASPSKQKSKAHSKPEGTLDSFFGKS
ncbi:DUF159-domain-containing protein [Pholiota conissans]|uniref:DUF159-domain-containing protein n=1 Tax=Pholiota conissans TaxID=109636 RepID=A0A9P6CSM2_9AGAR|nr:DUF159-domain-containing protein [Pholiota conissans]